MKKIFYLFVTVIFIYLGIQALKYYIIPIFISSPPKSTESIVKINETVYKVEIADSDDERNRGLSGRKSLSQDYGMLFLFENKDVYPFWMKDMRFSIDIIWIEDSTIVDITPNVPVPLSATYLPHYQPKQAVNKVLEISSGEAKKNGFEIGQKVEITLLQKLDL